MNKLKIVNVASFILSTMFFISVLLLEVWATYDKELFGYTAYFNNISDGTHSGVLLFISLIILLAIFAAMLIGLLIGTMYFSIYIQEVLHTVAFGKKGKK